LIFFISFRGASTVPVKKAIVPREVGYAKRGLRADEIK
jgi:hypothetical protein